VSSAPTALFPDTGLLPRTTYGYAVAAFDAAGNVSANSSPPLYATTLAPSAVQMGDPSLESITDSNPLGIQAEPVTAPASGALVNISIYIDPASSGPDSIELGLYSDNAGVPGTLLAATSSVNNPAPGTWLVLTTTAATVTSGTNYWLAYEVSGPSVKYRTGDLSVTVCGAPVSAYGPTPATYPSATCSGSGWSFYATIQP
jgi:hypothetical protein